MKYSLRSLMTGANRDRFFACVACAALLGGYMAIKAFAPPNGIVHWYRAGWCSVVIAGVFLGMWLTRRPYAP